VPVERCVNDTSGVFFVGALHAYREMVRRLVQYEGRRCLWRVGAGGLILAAIPTMPAGAIVADTYLAGRAPWPVVAAIGVAVVALTTLGTYLWRRQLWLAPVNKRLLTYECLDALPWAVRVLIRPADDLTAAAALRRAKFNPYAFLRIGSPPVDAPDLLVQIMVVRPAAWHGLASDEAQVEDVADVFRGAGIRARVAGIDVFE